MFRHKVMKLQSPKSSQVLSIHKPYFLMPGHMYLSMLCSLHFKSHNVVHNASYKFMAHVHDLMWLHLQPRTFIQPY